MCQPLIKLLLYLGMTFPSQCGTKPVILSLIPEYASSYVPKCRQNNFPILLQSLSDTAHQKLSFTDLLGTCNNVNLDISEEIGGHL